MRLPAAALGTALVEYRDLLLSYELRRLQISMFWKQDFTLERKECFSDYIKTKDTYMPKRTSLYRTLTGSCGDSP